MIARVLEQQAASLREYQRWSKGDQRNREMCHQASRTGTILEFQKEPVKESNGNSKRSGSQ